MRIIKVEYIEGYKIKLTFGNKETKIVDLSKKIKNAKGIFLPLKDVEFFKKVAVDDCQLSIFWPNGADICPDVLYEMGSFLPSKKTVLKKSKTAIRTPKRLSFRRSKSKAKASIERPR
jgi:hypothetical protein